MRTKVKGEAIKEGSIPLSALSNEVKGKIENAEGGADWNAKEGEAGYIENKPFGKHKVNGEIFDKSQNPLIRNVHYFIPYDPSIIDFEPSKKIDYIRVHWVDNDVVWIDETIKIPNDYITSVQTIKRVSETPLGSFNLDFEKTESEIRVYLIAQDESFSVSAESILKRIVVEAITCLSDEYLPDNILKTTPQSLSESAKNQALANLGIDPVVWKYICNPIIITSLDDRLPTDILKDDGTGIAMILPKYAGLIRGGYDSYKQKYVNACAVKSEENGFYYTVYIGGDLNITASIEFDGSLYYDDI